MQDASDSVRVLLIDEDRFSRAYLRSMLARRPKIQVLEAESALQGLEVLAQTPVEAVIMELALSDFDGMAMLQLIRTHPASSRAHIVIASTHTLEANVRKAIEFGVSDYLVKPFQPTDVERRLSALLQRVQKIRRLRADAELGGERRRVLVADNDLNFCSFVTVTLAESYEVKQAASSLEILVLIHVWSPDLLLLNPGLRGLNLEFLLDHLWAIPNSEKIQVYLLGSEQDLNRPTDRRISGWVQRTFVPKTLSEAVASILAPARLTPESAAAWLRQAEPEVVAAVLQVFAMMTRSEPVLAAAESSSDGDLLASLRLDSPRDGVSLVLGLRSRRSLGALLASKLTGVPDAEIDEELLVSGVGEVLHVAGGRLLEAFRAHHVQLSLRRPEIGPAGPTGAAPALRWSQGFRWEDRESFQVSLSCFLGA
jgi:two-component system chemotaxis response regulator CheY